MMFASPHYSREDLLAVVGRTTPEKVRDVLIIAEAHRHTDTTAAQTMKPKKVQCKWPECQGYYCQNIDADCPPDVGREWPDPSLYVEAHERPFPARALDKALAFLGDLWRFLTRPNAFDPND